MFTENWSIRKSEQLSLDYICGFQGKCFRKFHPFSVFSKPDRLETIQSHQFWCVECRSARHTARKEISQFRSFLKNFATEILVLNQENLVSGQNQKQKWIPHEKLPLT